MAEVFKPDLKVAEKPPETRMVIQRTELEDHPALVALLHAAQVRSRDASTSVAQADRDLYALGNKEKHIKSSTQIGNGFQRLVENLERG